MHIHASPLLDRAKHLILSYVSIFFARSDLSNNQIKKVAADAFHGLKSLESLYVSFFLHF